MLNQGDWNMFVEGQVVGKGGELVALRVHVEWPWVGWVT